MIELKRSLRQRDHSDVTFDDPRYSRLYISLILFGPEALARECASVLSAGFSGSALSIATLTKKHSSCYEEQRTTNHDDHADAKEVFLAGRTIDKAVYHASLLERNEAFIQE